jgi:Phasin protein
MPSDQDEFSKVSKKIGETTLQVQDEFIKTFEEMSRAVMSRATAEIELGVKLSQKLTAARSLPDVVSAYQEWLSEEMNARSEDARRFMSNGQKFITTSTRLFSNDWSSMRMST